MKWASLRNKTHYSILNSLIKPDELINRAAKLEIPALALTDSGNVTAYVQFQTAAKKKGIKPILGCDFYLSNQDATIHEPTNRICSHITLLAKNLTGWKQIIAATSESNNPKFYYPDKPRLDLDRVGAFADGNIIVLSGRPYSQLADVIFTDPRKAYHSLSLEETYSYVDKKWTQKLTNLAGKYIDIFGRENFFIEVQNFIPDRELPYIKYVVDGMRWLGRKLNIPCVAVANPHYAEQEDFQDHRVLLCSQLNASFRDIGKRIHFNDDVSLESFFRSERFYLPSPDEMSGFHSEAEIRNTNLVADMCEVYNILSDPKIPRFACPDGMDSDTFLHQLCVKGWKNKIARKIVTLEDKCKYGDRVKMELDVIKRAGILADYFLIVWDAVNWARDHNIIVGYGRGSGAGCLVSYLLGITSVDSIQYDLMFERFYNEGRNSEGHISRPDIDVDFDADRREEVLNYVRGKYGREHVCQMATYISMQGRSALRAVMHAHGYDEETQKRITDYIPDPSKIAGELQDIREGGDEATTIAWALEHRSNKLGQWCKMDEKGELHGEMAPIFAQAIRMEGVKKARSRHPSGVIISPENLFQTSPMVYDEGTKEHIIDLEMNDAEKTGKTKFDFLGIAMLSKIKDIQSLSLYGKIL